MIAVGVLVLNLRMDGCHSLKAKRHVLKGCLEKAQRDFRVSIAEVEDLELWNVATVAATAVSNSRPHTESVLRHVLELFDRAPEIVVESADLRLDQLSDE